MTGARYHLAAETFGPEEIAAAKAVLDSGRLTMGERVATFEREFAAYVGAPYAVMVNSGSSANLIAVDAMLRRSFGEPLLRVGDGVIVPALAWPTTVWPLVQLGLVPYFADIDPETLAIDLDSAAALLADGRCRGMFLTHVLGQAAPLEAYLDFCAQHGLVLLEDACESLGAYSSGTHVGTAGKIGTFSFYYSHHLSTIEGGMVVTADAALADDLRSLRAHGWVRERADRSSWFGPHDDRFLFVMPGYNLRPMEIQGAIGSVQLRRLGAMLTARASLAHCVRAWLPPWLELIGAGQGAACSWMALPLRLRAGAPISLTAVKRHLEEHGVETRPIIAGNLTRHPAMAHLTSVQAPSLAVADHLLTHGFMIGCHPVVDPAALTTLERALTTLGEP